MIRPMTPLPDDSEIVRLKAENERLRAALRKIADLPQHWKASHDAANEAVMTARNALDVSVSPRAV